MKKIFADLGPLWAFVAGWIFIMIALAFFIQARDYYGDNPIVRARLDKIEAFQSGERGSGGFLDPKGLQDTTVRAVMPADADLVDPRRPYNLLNGWLPPRAKPAYPTAERCRGVDFYTALEKTGNYRQFTNNYRHGNPDSCSGAPEEMNIAFYDVPSLPRQGCI